MKIASFDIGFRNFAFSVLEVDANADANVDSVIAATRVLKFKNINVLGNEKKNTETILVNLTRILDRYSGAFFNTCTDIIIEQQFNHRSRGQNMTAIKIAQHCYSYFLIKKLPGVRLSFVPARNKLKTFNAGKAETSTTAKRKKWSVAKAAQILAGNTPPAVYEKFAKHGKKDDIADSILQALSYAVTQFA